MLNSALGAYYYLRIIVMMYMREPRGDVPVTPIPATAAIAMAICVAATLTLGVFPGRALDYTTQSADQMIKGTPSPVASVHGGKNADASPLGAAQR